MSLAQLSPSLLHTILLSRLAMRDVQGLIRYFPIHSYYFIDSVWLQRVILVFYFLNEKFPFILIMRPFKHQPPPFINTWKDGLNQKCIICKLYKVYKVTILYWYWVNTALVKWIPLSILIWVITTAVGGYKGKENWFLAGKFISNIKLFSKIKQISIDYHLLHLYASICFSEHNISIASTNKDLLLLVLLWKLSCTLYITPMKEHLSHI